MIDSHELALFRQEISLAIRDGLADLTRPSAIFKPSLAKETLPGGAIQWRAMLLNMTATVIVVGWGGTPAEAMAAFDIAWGAPSGLYEFPKTGGTNG